MHVKRFVLAVMILFASCGGVYAQSLSIVSKPKNINIYTRGDQLGISSVVDSFGNFYVSYISYYDHTDSRLYVEKYSRSGVKMASIVQFNVSHPYFEKSTSLALSVDGAHLAVAYGSGFETRVLIASRSLAPATKKILNISRNSFSKNFELVSFVTSGFFLYQDVNNPGFPNIPAQGHAIDPTGRLISTVNLSRIVDPISTRKTLVNMGSGVIGHVYSEVFNNDYSIKFRKFNGTTGRAVGAPIVVSRSDSNSRVEPVIEKLVSGRLAIFWEDSYPLIGNPSSRNLTGAILNNNGTLFKRNIIVPNYPEMSGYSFSSPGISATADGGFVLGWMHGGFFECKGLGLAKYNALGVKTSNWARINMTIGQCLAAQIVANKAGYAMATWTTNNVGTNPMFRDKFGSGVGATFVKF